MRIGSPLLPDGGGFSGAGHERSSDKSEGDVTVLTDAVSCSLTLREHSRNAQDMEANGSKPAGFFFVMVGFLPAALA